MVTEQSTPEVKIPLYWIKSATLENSNIEGKPRRFSDQQLKRMGHRGK